MTPETKEEKDDDDGSNNNTQDMKQPSSEEEPKLDSNEQGEKEDFVNQGKIPLVLVAHCTVVLCAVACCCSHTHSLSCVGLRASMGSITKRMAIAEIRRINPQGSHSPRCR